jgi:hypothetical protein
MIASPLKLEAGLKRQFIERCTDGLALDFDRARPQPSRALGAGGAKLDGADDRAVTVDAPDGSRTVETANFEQLADDEAMRLFEAHLFGSRRSSHDEANQQNCAMRQHPVPLSQSAMLINSLFTITFAVELLDELRAWLTCSLAE